jgi:TonB family protein
MAPAPANSTSKSWPTKRRRNPPRGAQQIVVQFGGPMRSENHGGFVRKVFPQLTASIFLLVLLGTGGISTAARGGSQEPAATAPPPATYPATAQGLKSLLSDIFVAMRANDDARVSSFLAGLAIPNDAASFAKMFGAAEAARLDAKYRELQPHAAESLSRLYASALKSGHTEVVVQALQKESTTNLRSIHAALEAMIEPGQIYSASGTNPWEQNPVALGSFVYVDGGFRVLNSQVLQALSTAPPMRIRVGGSVTAAKLVNQVQPVYAPEAVANHVHGTVRLHVIIAVDGTPQEVTVLSGDPLLATSAVDAVRRWRYQQTMLNGTPVEVDTTIDVVFQ